MRIILVTGKGGVGKTSVAAATALHASQQGYRTLITSTDPAHSLADALNVRLGDRPVPVAERLEGAQLDGHARLAESWDDIRGYLVSVLEWAGAEEVQAEELSLLPGIEELFALTDVRRHVLAGTHDLLVVDCAPTAETLRLLSLPDALGWYVERAFGLERSFSRVVRPVLGRMTTMPLPPVALFGSVEHIYRQLANVRDILLDGQHATVRLVTNPERVVAAETRRLATALSLFGYHTDAVVVNRLIPETVVDPFFDRVKQRQATHLAAIRRDFDPPLLISLLTPDELVGLDALGQMGSELYGDRDPAEVLHHARPVSITRDGEQFCLTVVLPFADSDDVDIFRRSDELYVRVGSHTRNLVLPALLRRGEVVGAGFADGRLEVRFAVTSGDGAGAVAAEH